MASGVEIAAYAVAHTTLTLAHYLYRRNRDKDIEVDEGEELSDAEVAALKKCPEAFDNTPRHEGFPELPPRKPLWSQQNHEYFTLPQQPISIDEYNSAHMLEPVHHDTVRGLGMDVGRRAIEIFRATFHDVKELKSVDLEYDASLCAVVARLRFSNPNGSGHDVFIDQRISDLELADSKGGMIEMIATQSKYNWLRHAGDEKEKLFGCDHKLVPRGDPLGRDGAGYFCLKCKEEFGGA